MSQQTIYVLESADRTSGTVDAAVYNMIPAGGVEIGTYELLNYHSVNQTYNVETGVNDAIYFDEGAGELGPVAIVPGNYDAATLAAAIVVAMDSVSGSTYGVVYDAAAGKYTITITATTFSFNWATVATNKANTLMGFSATDTGLAAFHTSDNLVNLSLHTSMLIDIQEDALKNVTLLDGTEYSLMVPINEAFQSDIDSMRNTTYAQTIRFASSFNQLNVALFTEDGSVPVNSVDYVLSVRKLF